MRFPVVLLAVTAATAVVIKKPTAPNLPASAYAPHRAHMISYEDAVNHADLVNKTNTDTVAEKANAPVSTLKFSRLATTSNVKASNVKSSAASTCSQNPNVRYEWRQYSASDRAAFVQAIQCLINKPSADSAHYYPSQNRFEDFARVHQRFTPNIHQNPKFLVWHRYFLWTFEQVLRKECNFNRAMVWWDETKDAGKFAQSDMFSSSFFGALPAADEDGDPQCIVDGAFAGMTAHIGPGSGNSAHCLARAVDESLTAQCNTNFVNTCNSRSSYADMESCAEGGPHAYGHNGIGAIMSDVSASPQDPLFYMHHTFVDHGFRLWQNMDSSRVSTINGNDAQGNPLTMNTMIDVDGLGPSVPISAVMNTLGGTVINGVPFCYKYTY